MTGSRWVQWAEVLLLAGLWLGLPTSAGTRPARAETTAALKIMPLGDSITSGTNAYASFRCPLYRNLVGSGYIFDFVGSVHGQWGVANHDLTPPASCQNIDWDEEGHSGWRINDILQGASSWPGKLQTWAAAAAPDIVMIHLGTNDLALGESVDSTVTEMGQLIDVLRDVNPKVKILLAQIIPARMNGLNGQDVISIPQFNARLPALAASKSQANSPILVVDMYTNFFVDVHTVDGVHPNGNGEQKMANRWLAGINQLTKVVLSKRFFIPLVTK